MLRIRRCWIRRRIWLFITQQSAILKYIYYTARARWYRLFAIDHRAKYSAWFLDLPEFTVLHRRQQKKNRLNWTEIEYGIFFTWFELHLFRFVWFFIFKTNIFHSEDCWILSHARMINALHLLKKAYIHTFLHSPMELTCLPKRKNSSHTKCEFSRSGFFSIALFWHVYECTHRDPRRVLATSDSGWKRWQRWCDRHRGTRSRRNMQGFSP